MSLYTMCDTIPIKVRGTGTNGVPFEEETFTILINGYGAQIALLHTPELGRQLTITNLRNGKSSPFRLVCRMGRSSSAHVEWGVESLQPDARFWGISFPAEAPPSSPGEAEMIEALLECQGCGTRELARLTWREYRILGKRQYLKRDCEPCLTPTDWSFVYLDGEETLVEPRLSSPPASAGGGSERRQARRLTLRVPVHLHLADGREVAAVTENLGRIGLCIVAAAKINVGEVIRITFGESAPKRPVEVWGQVVRGRRLARTDKAVYGVSLQERG